jgi:hypothetical protein
MLNLPPTAITQLVSQNRLLDRLPEPKPLVTFRPRLAILDLVEQIDLHVATLRR